MPTPLKNTYTSSPPPRRKSRSPRRKSRSPRRKSPSPRRKSRSPRRKSRSPRRKSRSPRRKSPSPRRKSRSPRRKSPSPRRKSPSPRRKSPSPRRKSPSPRKNSKKQSEAMVVDTQDVEELINIIVEKTTPPSKRKKIIESILVDVNTWRNSRRLGYTSNDLGFSTTKKMTVDTVPNISKTKTVIDKRSESWKLNSPTKEQQLVLGSTCREKCFLDPKKKAYPICKDESCQVSCDGLRAAKIEAEKKGDKSMKSIGTMSPYITKLSSRIFQCIQDNKLTAAKELCEIAFLYFPNSHDLIIHYGLCHYLNDELSKALEIWSSCLPTIESQDDNHQMLKFLKLVLEEKAVFNQLADKPILTLPSRSPHQVVTLTMTTCKRIDLFKRTVNSFLNACLDLELIYEWIVIDDNSSEKDRQEMRDTYPFIRFICKTEKEKGHATSLNILFNEVQTPYIFHMEDDWQWVVKRPYITHCLQVLNNNRNDNIKQCLVNQHYAETMNEQNVYCGYFKQINDLHYIEHEFDAVKAATFNQISHMYWPHFSLRPGLMDVKTLQEIGKFSTDPSCHFEMDYGYRYVHAGYKTAFLQGINCIHIGRLTNQRNDPTVENAYSLNDTSQFGIIKSPKTITDVINNFESDISSIFDSSNLVQSREPEPLDEEENESLPDLQKPILTKIINMANRPDRKEQMQQILKDPQLQKVLDYSFYKAINGWEISPTHQLYQLFDNNDYNYRKGCIGCALSHIDIWMKHIQEDSENDILCIIHNCDTSVWDILFLGHFQKHPTPRLSDVNETNRLLLTNAFRALEHSNGGTVGYLITRQGAKLMLDFIEKEGMTNCIDTMMQKAVNYVKVCYLEHQIVHSEFYTADNSNQIDTDIQKNHDNYFIPIDNRIAQELKFLEEDCNIENPRQYLKTTTDNTPTMDQYHYSIGPHHFI
eukprot:Awhi_evm6s10337